MRKFSNIATSLAAAAGLLLLSAPVVSAGVVWSETETADGLPNDGVQHRTIYIQGHKQRVDSDGVQTIVDLDKQLIYLIDTNQKNYVELPLASLSGLVPKGDGDAGDSIELKRTGGTHVVAAHSCDEYRGYKAVAQLQITVSACVSTSAPGAQEIAKFDQAMFAQIDRPRSSGEAGPPGVVLEKQSEVSLTLSEAKLTTSVVSRSMITAIKVRPLAAQTFKPPKGYNKIQIGPHENVPHNLEAVMLHHAAARAAALRL
jgi:hypothetical protein